MNLVTATLKSDNSVYEQLDLDLGPESVTKTARDMGITSPLHSYPAEGLGGLTNGVSPLEMARAYATIANGGWRVRPVAIRKVTFPDHHVENLGKVRRHRVFTAAPDLRGHQDPREERPGGHRHEGADRLPGGRQDRHGRRLHRRLVRRLHAGARDLGLGRPRGRAPLAGRGRGGRRGGRADLGRLHEDGQGQLLRQLPAARDAVPVGPRSSASTAAPGGRGTARRPTRHRPAGDRRDRRDRRTPATPSTAARAEHRRRARRPRTTTRRSTRRRAYESPPAGHPGQQRERQGQRQRHQGRRHAGARRPVAAPRQAGQSAPAAVVRCGHHVQGGQGRARG